MQWRGCCLRCLAASCWGPSSLAADLHYRLPYVSILHMEDVRVTVAVAAVLSQFLEDAAQPRYGYDLMRSTGFASGKLYPILFRLERAGWLTRELEDCDPAEQGRPRRRMYRLTPDGARGARRVRGLEAADRITRAPR